MNWLFLLTKNIEGFSSLPRQSYCYNIDTPELRNLILYKAENRHQIPFITIKFRFCLQFFMIPYNVENISTINKEKILRIPFSIECILL